MDRGSQFSRFAIRHRSYAVPFVADGVQRSPEHP
jgi:hypothetical protein